MSKRNDMQAPFGVAPQPIPQPLLTPPSSPVLSLSSANAGWEGLMVRAFHQPMEYDHWLMESAPTISLVLFFGGAMRLEWLCPSSSWNAQDLRHGDANLCFNWEGPLELRWKTLSGGPMQTLHLHLSRNLILRTAEDLTGGDSAHLSLAKRIGFRDPLLTQLGIVLWHELKQESPAGKLYAQTAEQLLAVHLLRHYSSVGGKIKDPAYKLTEQQVRRVVDFIQSHLDQHLSLEILAQQIGFSPYHFARVFRQTLGESPHQCVMRHRITQAQRLLTEKDTPLAQVAMACGFTNQSHFTKTFKRYLGATPRVYRHRGS
jgi:AraC family transcriptional regulator